jgi:flagellar biogenesis protein FliO
MLFLDTLGLSSWAADAFLALIAAIAAVVGAIWAMQKTKRSPRSAVRFRMSAEADLASRPR